MRRRFKRAVIALAMCITACGPTGQSASSNTNTDASARAASADTATLLRQIILAGATGYDSLKGEALPGHDPSTWRSLANPYGLHCNVSTDGVEAGGHRTFVCFSDGADGETPPRPEREIWATYDQIKADLQTVAPGFSWIEKPSKPDAQEIVRTGADATGAYVEGGTEQHPFVLQLRVGPDYPHHTYGDGAWVLELEIGDVAAELLNSAARPQSSGTVQLVCSIRFCTNISYPDWCNTATRRYAFDLRGNTVTLNNGRTGPIQQSENTISWTDIYEYLGAPVSETQFSVDRSTLQLHAETPGSTIGQCQMDHRQF